MSGRSILIVDDNPLNSKLTRLVLTNKGYQVEIAGDAEQALEVLKSLVPDLILMDLQLPGMDGFELTRLLKLDPRMRNVAIVALTAYAMKGDEQRALAAGCDGYIAKPIDTRTLPGLIADYLANRTAAANPETERGA